MPATGLSRDSRPHLADDSSIVIVGGGPAGCFAAIHALEFARQRGIAVDVTIVERQGDFGNCGRFATKGCAGVVSSRAVANMASVGVHIPDELVMDEITSYVMRLPGTDREVTFLKKSEPGHRILSVCRGHGPWVDTGEFYRSFDRFLRLEACRRGAAIVQDNVRTIEWDGGPVVVGERERRTADLLVLACGVNTACRLSSHYRYQQPATALMLQEGFPRPETVPAGRVGAYFGEPGDIFFATMVPKREYVNVSMLGKDWRTVRREAMGDFLRAPACPMPDDPADAVLAKDPAVSRIVAGSARRCFGDRWVAVGDAAVSRLYKDGIGSAFITSRQAMQTALAQGISERDFRRGYAPLCRQFARRNAMGRFLFWAFGQVLRRRWLSRAVLRCIASEQRTPGRSQHLSEITWGMLTGEYPYSRVLGMLASPSAIVRLGWAVLCETAAAGARRRASCSGAPDQPHDDTSESDHDRP